MARRQTRRGFVTAGVASVALFCAWPAVASTPAIAPEIAERLTPEQLAAYRAHLVAKTSFDKQLEMYWVLVEERRDHRRRKRIAGQPFDATDYIAEQPPRYTGPPMPPEVAKIIAVARPPEPEKLLPGVADFLSHAKTQFGFVPTITTEREFKRRYAHETLALGLTRTQVVRVYALETGGQGTLDMQSGIDPITKTGKPISSALGYAQLLGANSTSELVKHGEAFIQRLNAMAASPGVLKEHAVYWNGKAEILRRMLKSARSVPNEWRHHETFSRTPAGLGIHTINMDADIGPWLQALKLKGIMSFAADNGRTNLTGAELEMMNLAGPRTGLDMMDPVGRLMPTTNFFSQGGYYRNGVVRDRTGAELLRALDDRMDVHIKKPGSIEFLAVFDEVMAERGIREPAPRPQVQAPQPSLHSQIFGNDK